MAETDAFARPAGAPMSQRRWPPTSTRGLSLAAFGSFHVGGRAVALQGLPPRTVRLTNAGTPAAIDPNGTHWVEAMYAQYFVPQPQRFGPPLMLWHGGGLTGACWETTPDGREGWLPYFVRRGWATLSCDAVERGRAGFAPTPQVFLDAPMHQPVHWAWDRFRIGAGSGSWHDDPQRRRPMPGGRFPVQAYDRFVKQFVPRWTETDEAILRGYLALIDEVGPCCVLAHSQGGQFALQAAQARPDVVQAVVLVEPSGFANPAQAHTLRRTPILVVQGDGQRLEGRSAALRERVDVYFDVLRAAGVTVELLDLPAQGIGGNSHMMMMDLNSDDIAGLIATWLESQRLVDLGPPMS